MTLVKRDATRQTSISADASPRSALRDLPGPERLTGMGFRCWLAGQQNGQLTCWEDAWNLYARELGPDAARTAIRDLSCWVRAISGHAQREIRICPAGCDRFAYDECLAVSMIAAAQHDCPAIKACAYALLGAQPIEEVIVSASRFAACLRDNRVVLGPGPIVDLVGGAATDGLIH